MTRAARRAAVGLGLAAAVGLAAVRGTGQEPGTTPKAVAVAGGPPAGVSSDTGACIACHSGATERAARGFVRDFKSQLFVRLNESIAWDEQDPHSRAFEVIVPDDRHPIAKQMQDVLKAASGDKDYTITKDARCLACHATDLNPTAKGKRQAAEFAADEGVGVACAGCHGVDVRWQTAHFAGPRTADRAHLEFRTLPPERKASEYGLRNLRDPGVKAGLCASCHVGNPDEGKVITHEMYAAGHPPLPPLELVTFMEAEPRHWGYPTELSFLTDYAKDDPTKGYATFRFWDQKSLKATAAEYAARHVAVGAVGALKAEMQTIQAEAKGPAGGTVDFARFDCYACHHDLKYPSDRQEQGYEAVPGRPTLKAWVGGLTGVVAAHAGGLPQGELARLGGEFESRWAAVRAAATDRPFGNPARLASAADEMAKWCDGFAAAVAKEPVYTEAAARDLMARIGAAAGSDKRAATAEPAMHLTWAYRSLRQAIDGDAEKLDVLRTKVPISPRDLTGVPRKDPKRPVTVGDILSDRQRVFNAYSAKAFTEAFRSVAGQR